MRWCGGGMATPKGGGAGKERYSDWGRPYVAGSANGVMGTTGCRRKGIVPPVGRAKGRFKCEDEILSPRGGVQNLSQTSHFSRLERAGRKSGVKGETPPPPPQTQDRKKKWRRSGRTPSFLYGMGSGHSWRSLEFFFFTRMERRSPQSRRRTARRPN